MLPAHVCHLVWAHTVAPISPDFLSLWSVVMVTTSQHRIISTWLHEFYLSDWLCNMENIIKRAVFFLLHSLPGVDN